MLSPDESVTGEWDNMHILDSRVFLKRFHLFIFREREEERERNINVREKHWLVASFMPLTWDMAHNPGMCPDQESNRQPFALWEAQPTEPHQSGSHSQILIP